MQSIPAIKKGRYTLEKRARAISEAKKFWENGVTNESGLITTIKKEKVSSSSSEGNSPVNMESDYKNVDVFLSDIQNQESPRTLMNQLPDLGNRTDPKGEQMTEQGKMDSARELDTKVVVKTEVTHTSCSLGVTKSIDDRSKHCIFGQVPTDVISIARKNVDDEENLDQIIDTAVAAFERQNFLNKGFLGKVSQYQHSFMVSCN